jgi:hypothetical protein
MKKILCLLTAFATLTVWPTQSIAQERENGHKKTVVVHTGKVVSFERGDPARVVVKTEKVPDLNVELAPMSFIESNKLTLAADSDVTVRGFEEMRDGRNVFVATEVTSGTNVVRLRDPEFKPLWTVKTVEGAQPSTALVSVTGRVKTFTKGDPALVVLETEKGAITTELAPMSFVEENKLVLTPDQAITVRGYESTRDGKTYFVASEVTMPDRRIIRLRSDAREPVWVKTTETTTLREADITDLDGTVTIVDTKDTPDGRYITIKTTDGPRVIAVGPGTYLEKNKYVFVPGERVRVRGWHTHRHGARVFLASDVHRGDVVWRFRRPDGRVLWID